MADELIRVRSALPVLDAVNRLGRAVAVAGSAVVARVDHAAGAASIGMALRRTTLLLCANPRGGTPLMQASQAVGIELPMRALAWEYAEGAAWPRWLRCMTL